MPRPAKKVAAALEAKGMAPNSSKHHIMFSMTLDGVTTLITRISHGTKEISDSNAGKMANQCALQFKEFMALVDCTMSGEDWGKKVRERCADGRNPFMPHR